MKNLIKKAATSTVNFAKDSAIGILGITHFVATSIADGCEILETKINREVDPEQVRNERMRSTCDKQDAVLRAIAKLYVSNQPELSFEEKI